jgi:integrase
MKFVNRMKLTTTAVGKLVFPVGGTTKTGKPLTQVVVWDTETRGLGVRLNALSNTKTYLLQRRVKGEAQERSISLGRHGEPVLNADGSLRGHAFGAEDARARALGHLAQLLAGVDPVAAARLKREQVAAQAGDDAAKKATLREVMNHYIENKQTKYGPLRPRTRESITACIERHLPAWLDLPMAGTITRDACLVRFTEMSDSEVNQRTGQVGKKGSASLLFVYLRALCNHARDLYENPADGAPRIFAVNPISRMVKVRKLNPAKVKKGRIPRDKIGAVYNILRIRATSGRTDIERTAADWLCFVALTGTRLTESGSLKKVYVDLNSNTVHFPGEVTKNHHDLTLPLSAPLIDILRPRLDTPPTDTAAARRRHRVRSSEYVFPSFGHKSPYLTDPRGTLDAISEVANVRDTSGKLVNISTHDLRRTYEDILRYAKVDPDERRLILNHIGGDVHSVSYSNSDDPETLRPAMEAAAEWVLQQARIADSSNVVPLFPEKASVPA